MIPPRIHGIIDYLSVAALLLAPFLLGLEGSARNSLLAVGLFILIYSLITDYPQGIVAIIPWRLHLMLDVGTGLVLMVMPWVLGFAGTVQWPHLLFGAFAVAVPTLSVRHHVR